MASINPVSALKRAFGDSQVENIQSSKILLVGSGGIGCELLKDLSLSGFRHVEVIDLDTIDVSNLNRQLLFRGKHVGMPKCTVACEVAQEMIGDGSAKYIAHHGNVCDNAKFNVPFVSQFHLVLNALDNVEARRRVNRLCLAAGVPLIEAGTTGYLGQVTVIHKPSHVACYECTTQETQKVYPICTIRSTPSMPVHTIVWAKELYKLLFHHKVEESMLFEDTSAEDSEKSTYMAVVERVRSHVLATSAAGGGGDEPKNADAGAASGKMKDDIQELLVALYKTEIDKQLGMDKYKTAKKTPKPLEQADVLSKTMVDEELASSMAPSRDTESIWQPKQCVVEIVKCLLEAVTRNGDELLQEFDKDDDLCMRFVTAAANLRSAVFGIEPLQSIYSAKGIAGNIIPAIATTNAICAGLQMLQVYKILKAQMDNAKNGKDKSELDLKPHSKYVNCVRNKTRNGLYVTASALEGQNPKCFVCRSAVVPLTLNTKQWTLGQLLSIVAKGRLGFEQPTVMLQGDVIWEEGEGSDQESYEPNLKKQITDLPCGGIQHGTVVEMEDFSQDLTIQVSIVHKETWEEGKSAEDMPFVVGGEVPKATPAKPAGEDDSKKEEGAEAPDSKPAAVPIAAADDDDDICIIDDDPIEITTGEKRTLDDDNGDGDLKPAAKRARTGPAADEVIMID